MLPLHLINALDYPAIIHWALGLLEPDRAAALEALRQFDIERDIAAQSQKPSSVFLLDEALARAKSSFQFDEALALAKVACTRRYSELATFPLRWPTRQTVLHGLIKRSCPEVQDALIQFFTRFPPDYLDKVLRDLTSDDLLNIDFRLLWRFWQYRWVSFDEALFVRSLFIISDGYGMCRNVQADVDFLSREPEIVESVLLPFFQYDIPVLNMCRWQDNGVPRFATATYYWDAVFAALFQRGLLDRRLIADLIASLSFSAKKGRLDWHIRLLKTLTPTAQEWLTNQEQLFAALYASSNTVVNFAVQVLQSLRHEAGFDRRAVIQHLPAVAGREKCDKSLLILLKMAETVAESTPEYRPALAEAVAGSLMQTEEKIQLRAAQLMLKYHTPDALQPLVAPYAQTLKATVADLLQVTSPGTADSVIPVLTSMPVAAPDSWEALLFHTGKTLSSCDALDVDLFYSAVIALQGQFPTDYAKQMKPYLKKLANRFLESSILIALRDFLEEWCGDKTERQQAQTCSIDWLQNKNRLALERLAQNCTLPLLSTPTHSPFYVAPEALVERLLHYEQAQHPVELEDLIIACNRLLPGEVCAPAKEKAQRLTGEYADALRYLLGVTDSVAPTADAMLPLWAQVTRTRDAQGAYPQYELVAPKQAVWPAVARPLNADYYVYVDQYGSHTWHRLRMRGGVKKDGSDGSSLYYYTGVHGDEHARGQDFSYRLSLAPCYPDALLLRILPDCATGNEIVEQNDCFYPLRYLLENQLKVYHGGWVYIAACLLFEKKGSRELAAEYIQLALQLGFLPSEYVSECVAYLLMHKFAPINRFMEYLNRPGTTTAVKTFQRQVIEACMNLAENTELPTGYKKMAARHAELKGI